MGARVFHGSRSDLLVGARFGQYAIVRTIGHGGSASVYEARHVVLGRLDALKVLHEHLAASAQIAARFLREARVAAQLRHPHIVDVIDVGVEGTTPYMVMELLEGEDLSSLLSRQGRLPADEALALLLPIASALAFAHDRDAVHRDVKPANVFVGHDLRGDPLPKVVDFGLSKLVGKEEGLSLTEGAMVGTVHYMAPEQTLGGAM
jgi:serine/threonine-protein kinase